MSLRTIQIDRRAFLKSSLATAGALACPSTFRAAQSQSPSRKLNLAFVGVGGKGADGLRILTDHNSLAFRDVDDVRAAHSYKKFPNIQRFNDFRKMHDRFGKQIDEVLVCTPDHTHFHSVAGAMQTGKHCRYHFPAAAGRGTITVHWYSGKKGIEANLPRDVPYWPAGRKFSDTGFAICGTLGTIYIGDMRAENRPTIFPEKRALEFKTNIPSPSLPRIKGDHFHDSTNAILEGRRACADFSYGAPLSEVAFLGNLAIRTGREIVWDRNACKAVGVPEADAMIHPSPARTGWEFKI